MGKVKGQFDFCRMTRGHLSFVQLMSCQCGVKGGRGAALLTRAPRPPPGRDSADAPAPAPARRCGGAGPWKGSTPGTGLRGRKAPLPAWGTRAKPQCPLLLSLEAVRGWLSFQRHFLHQNAVSLPRRFLGPRRPHPGFSDPQPLLCSGGTVSALDQSCGGRWPRPRDFLAPWSPVHGSQSPPAVVTLLPMTRPHCPVSPPDIFPVSLLEPEICWPLWAWF